MTTSPADGSGPRAETRWGRLSGRRALAYGLMAVPAVVISVGFFPGHMNGDSLYELDQAAGNIALTDHHTPILLWLWHLLWPLGLRPGVVLVLSTVAAIAGAYLLARAAFSRLGAALVACGVAFAPSVFGDLGLIGRDVWFLDLLLLTGGLLVLAQRSGGRMRTFALAGSLVAAFLCLASRQNALAVVAILLIAIVAFAFAPQLAGRRRLVRLGFPAVVGVATGVLMIAVQLVVVAALPVDRVHPEQYLYLYDLAGLSVRDGENDFPESVYPFDDIRPIAQASNLDTILPLAFGERAPIPMPRSGEQVSELKTALIDQIEDDPLQYLDWRIDAFGRQIGLDAPGVFVYHPGIDPNHFGYEVEVGWANDAVKGYQQLFTDSDNDGQVFHRAWMYLLLSLFALIVLLRSSVPARTTVGAMALGNLTYQAGLFFGTMGTQWRFEFPVAAVTIIATAVAVKELVDRRRWRAAAAGRQHGSIPRRRRRPRRHRRVPVPRSRGDREAPLPFTERTLGRMGHSGR